MKNLIVLAVIACLFFSCNKKETQVKESSFQSYGTSFDQTAAQDIFKLNDLMNDSDSVALTLSGKINKTCAVKGCWMQVKNGEESSIRVTFQDYGFFVPKSGEEGKTAIINGYCVKQETSIEELQHFAKDAGESEEFIAAIIAPKMEYSFVASGVIIED